MLTVLLITRLVLRRVFELFRIGLRTNCALSENLASAPIKSEPIGKDGGARFGERGVNPFATAECGDFTAASSGEVEHDEPDSCSFSETSSQLSGNVTSGEILRRRRRKPLKKTKAGNKLRRRDCGRTSLGRPGSRGKLAPLISDCESTRRSRPGMDQEAFNARQARKSICERSRMIGFQDGTEMTTAGHQKKVEDDTQQQTLVEYCVWGEGYQRLDEIIAGFHRRYEHEVADLQSAMKRLEKDKDRLQNSLIRSQIKISYLQVEMEALRKRNVYQRLQHEREKNNIKKMLTECHSYYSHMKWLQQNMPESSDWFYSKLYRNAEQSCKREKNVKTVPDNTLKNRRTDQYQDSGLSLCTDTVDSSSSECDYEDHKDILECVYKHSSGEGTQRLDNEMSDWKSEHTYLAPSRYDSESLASTRKLLSAFSCQVGKENLSNTFLEEIRNVSPTASDILDAKESAPIYRLVLAGDVGTGKSSFLLRLSMNEFRSDIQMTLGVDMHIKMMLVDGEKTHLQIWDTAGQERFCSISQSYFRKAHGVLLLYDVTSKASFFNIREWMDQIKESTDEALSMCVIGNKADLRAELPEDSCVSSAHGEKLATIYNALFCETSAKEGTNVVEAVLHLAREIKKSASLRPTSPLDLQMEQMDGKVLWQ